MRLKSRTINKSLCHFLPPQRALIKSRLFLYRHAAAEGTKPLSWNRIAQNITDLPELYDLPNEDREHIRERFRYYLITKPHRGRDAPSTQEIAAAEFSVSADPLNRWFIGQSDRAYDETNSSNERSIRRSPYTPDNRTIAAIRDFLVVTGFLLESQLAACNSELASAIGLNELFGFDPVYDNDSSPVFQDLYLSYSVDSNELLEQQIEFKYMPELGVLCLFRQSRRSTFGERRDISNRIRRRSTTPAARTEMRYGWIARGLFPAALAFSSSQDNPDVCDQVSHISINSFTINSVSMFEFCSVESFARKGSMFSPLVKLSKPPVFIRHNYPSLVEYFLENVYTDEISKRATNFYGRTVSERLDILTQNYENSGKQLYDVVLKTAKASAGTVDYRAPVQLIELGAEVNYWHEERRHTTLHMVAAYGLRDTMKAMIQIPGLNYLVKDGNGMLPSDLAFRSGADAIGRLLARKELAQAKAQGIDFRQFLTDSLELGDPTNA